MSPNICRDFSGSLPFAAVVAFSSHFFHLSCEGVETLLLCIVFMFLIIVLILIFFFQSQNLPQLGGNI